MTYADTVDEETGEVIVPTDVSKRDVQLFKKRLRKESPLQRLRYYTTAEYGGITGRPHYHSIMFNLDRRLIPKVAGIYDTEKITKIWGLGNVVVGEVETASIHYVTKYVINKQLDYQSREPP